MIHSSERVCAPTGAEYRVRLIDQAVELLGYHRKAAIRALNTKPKPPERAPAVRTGRPREYHPGTLLVVLRPIWFAAQQPCGNRLAAMRPEWLPAYETDHRRLDADVREALFKASGRTLDRLLVPLRAGLARRGGTRPGSLLPQSIPNPAVVPQLNALCKGALGLQHNHFLCAHKLREKRRVGRKPTRLYGPAQSWCSKSGEYLGFAVGPILLLRRNARHKVGSK